MSAQHDDTAAQVNASGAGKHNQRQAVLCQRSRRRLVGVWDGPAKGESNAVKAGASKYV